MVEEHEERCARSVSAATNTESVVADVVLATSEDEATAKAHRRRAETVAGGGRKRRAQPSRDTGAHRVRKAMNAVDVKRAEVELAEATVAKEDAVEDAAAVKAKTTTTSWASRGRVRRGGRDKEVPFSGRLTKRGFIEPRSTLARCRLLNDRAAW